MSIQLPTGDLTSPTSFMNNTHMKLEHGLQVPGDQQQHLLKPDYVMAAEPSEHQQQLTAPQLMGSNSMQPQPSWALQQQGSGAHADRRVWHHARLPFSKLCLQRSITHSMLHPGQHSSHQTL